MRTKCGIPPLVQHELKCGNQTTRPTRILIHKSATWYGDALSWDCDGKHTTLIVHGWTPQDKQAILEKLGTMEADFLEIQING